MRALRPLPNNQELVIIDTPNLCREYRIESIHTSPGGRDGLLGNAPKLSIGDACIALFLAVLWPMTQAHTYCQALMIIGAMVYLYARCTRVLHESVIAIPSLGIQFETHRGFPPFTLSVKRTFVSLAELDDIIINEALYGWNVRYYIAALYGTGGFETRLHVAYENILPRHSVLRPILHDLHQYLNVV